MPVISPGPPPGQYEAAADQCRQEHAGHTPVTEGSAHQGVPVRAQQRSVRADRQQYPASQPSHACKQLNGGEAAASNGPRLLRRIGRDLSGSVPSPGQAVHTAKLGSPRASQPRPNVLSCPPMGPARAGPGAAARRSGGDGMSEVMGAFGSMSVRAGPDAWVRCGRGMACSRASSMTATFQGNPRGRAATRCRTRWKSSMQTGEGAGPTLPGSGECSVWGRATDRRPLPAGKVFGRLCAVRADPPGTRPAVSQMGAAPNPRALTGRSGASSHGLRFPLRAFLRFPGCPPGSSPSSAFLWFPFVRRSPVRSLRPLPGSGSPSVSLRVPFPLGNLHVSAAAGRFRRRRSQAAGTKVTSSAATTSPGSRDPPALQIGSRWARWDAATESPVTSGRRAQDIHGCEPAPCWRLRKAP